MKSGAAGRRRVRDLFEAALDVPNERRMSWLRQQSTDDDVIREVESLLEHHERAGTFLNIAATADVLSSGAALAPGAQVGPYVIERDIGRGGMGRLYLAADPRLDRRVAIKAILPRFAHSPSYRERLRREARVMAALSHPGICAVYSLEEVEGGLFLVTEFVEGTTLREEIDRGGRPDPAQAVQTARQLAEALEAAHRKGITHRDLKPANVIRRNDGVLKILDFGIADAGTTAAGDVNTSITVAGSLLGTPVYMSPEQLTGGRVDARSDVFAFGLLMFEYATGAHPFAAPTELQTVARMLEGDAPSVVSRRPDLPSELSAVIDHSLLRSPDERFASASSIVETLRRGMSAATLSASLRWWRVHQAAVVLLYALVCVLTWQVKEWGFFPARGLFLAAGVIAAFGGVTRGHLLFVSRMHPARVAVERRKTARALLLADVVLAVVVFVAGALASAGHALVGVLIMGLAVGMAIAALLIEPSTSAAAFRDSPPEQA